MTQTSFDDLTDVYEAIIDWPKRLAHETPFFQSLFDQAKVKHVADVACGTGHHANLFHSWGLEVRASDISPSMIQRARTQFGESERLRWKVQGFDSPIAPASSFDAVVCIGNSLALAADMAAAAQALRQMLHALRPKGLAIVHLLNLWKLPLGPCVWQKAVRRPGEHRDSIILKGVHRCGEEGFVELVVIGDPTVDAPIRSNSVRFLGLKAEHLEAFARESGATDVTFFGSHEKKPYDPHHSSDLIMVATRGETR